MSGPVVDLRSLLAALQAVRAYDPDAQVVLTNGVFDLLHIGHLRYLRRARAEGDLLVVGINSDASAAALKPGRPVVPARERAELVAALDPVNYVVIFDAPTASDLIVAIRPAVYAKGGDYSPERLPEAATADASGARLALLPLVPDHSTSRLLATVQARTMAS